MMNVTIYDYQIILFFIYNTSNGGQTWKIKYLAQQELGSKIYFINKNIGWICGIDGKLFKTTDEGHQWFNHNIDTYRNLNKILFVDDKHGWILGDSILFYTTNGGDTWLTDSQMYNKKIYDIQFIDSLTGWAVGVNGEIWHTTTGGRTSVNDNRQSFNLSILSVSPNPASTAIKLQFESAGYFKTQFFIFDILGYEIYKSGEFCNIGINEKEIDCSLFEIGYYFIRVQQQGRLVTKPFTILK